MLYQQNRKEVISMIKKFKNDICLFIIKNEKWITFIIEYIFLKNPLN